MYSQRFSLALLVTLVAAGCFTSRPASAQGFATVDGTIRDSIGAPIPGAKVFLESGLEGPLLVTQADDAGAFAFADLIPGTAGVFAYAQGRAINGGSLKLALDAVEHVDIILPNPGTLAGTVQDEKGKPVPRARITRALIRGESMVGIPLAKLVAHGIPEPQTDDRGNFNISTLPQGVEVSLKVAHPQFAQEAPLLRVGDTNARIKLSIGVLVSGTVVARGRDLSVPNATLFFVNAEPPNDSVIVRSQNDGSFAVRLKPGPWLYQASGPSFRSANALKVLISADYPNQRVTLQVAGTATLRGTVKDAKSGDPIVGARIELLASGAPAAVATTGPTGAYELTATDGDAVVRLASAPGHLLPPSPALPLAVQAGQTTELPTFWVAPLPRYSLEVVDFEKNAVPGAIVRVLRPEQLGWYATDKDGLVELSFASLPSDGTVVGMVEHPSRPEGALFAITRNRSADAIVQLIPLTSLSATVLNEKKSGLPGVLVEARTTLEGIADPITLWRAFTSKDGALHWPAVVPKTQLALFTVSIATKDAPSLSVVSAPLLPEPDVVSNAGSLILAGASPGRSALGKEYAWYKHTIICGALPTDADNCPAVIVHAPASQVAMMADTLAQAQRFLNRPDIVFAVVSTSDLPCGTDSIPILRGNAPSSAYTFVVDAEGVIILECAGLPPVSTISGLAPRS